MKKAIKNILLVAMIFIIVFLLYALLDIYDIPSQVGIPIQRINWDAAGLVCGNLVVVALFAITYQALDKRSIQKAQNQRTLAIHMIHSTISACCAQVDLLKNSRYMNALLNSMDTEIPLDENSHTHLMFKIPFEYHETIVSFAADGVISDEEFMIYHMAKLSYYTFVNTIFTHYENEEIRGSAEQMLSDMLEMAEALLDA